MPFMPITKVMLVRLGVSVENIGTLEQLEDDQRAAQRRLRVPSEATLLRRRARELEKQQRRSKMR